MTIMSGLVTHTIKLAINFHHRSSLGVKENRFTDGDKKSEKQEEANRHQAAAAGQQSDFVA